MSGEDKVPVYIPKRLYERVSEFIEGTSFSSVSDYVVALLEREHPEEGEEPPREVVERLKRLGYL